MSAPSVPRWSITSNSGLFRNGSSQPMTGGRRMRCADEEMGRNSVSPWTTPMTMAWTTSSTANATAAPPLADEERREHQGDRREELHEDVQGWPGRVLERVAHRVAHDRRGVGRGLLADDGARVVD